MLSPGMDLTLVRVWGDYDERKGVRLEVEIWSAAQPSLRVAQFVSSYSKVLCNVNPMTTQPNFPGREVWPEEPGI